MKMAAINRMAGSQRKILYEGMGIILSRDLNKSTTYFVSLKFFTRDDRYFFSSNFFSILLVSGSRCGMSPIHHNESISSGWMNSHPTHIVEKLQTKTIQFLLIFLITLSLIGCVTSPSSLKVTVTPGIRHTSTPEITSTDTPIGSLIPDVPTGTPVPLEDPVLVGAVDIADCDSNGDEATAALLDNIPGIVFTTGDNAYEDGTYDDFMKCYDSSWGRHKDRTYPSPGNHDYHTDGASGYFDYFGLRAGDPDKGYYSYQLGKWHIIALNSNIPVHPGSEQEQWLRADLAANPLACTLAYWHFPLFSSSNSHGSDPNMEPLWQALYDFAADVVLAGHDHTYERFAPQSPQGVADPINGIRQFVIGSGGRSQYQFDSPIANSEVRNGDTYGVLKLTLHSDNYS